MVIAFGLGGAMRQRSGTALADLIETGDPSKRDTIGSWTRCRRLGRESRKEAQHANIELPVASPRCVPWNKVRLVAQKRPSLAKQVWAIRARLELAGDLRDLALFNFAIDSRLSGCDLVGLKVADRVVGAHVRERVPVIQSKTGRPAQFEVAENTRTPLMQWVDAPEMRGCRHLFPSRFLASPHLSTRHYARLVRDRVSSIGLDPSGYGSHSLRRTKAALIYRKTGNLRAVQLLLDHTKVDSTVGYLGVEHRACVEHR